jgi:hypothetical protein
MSSQNLNVNNRNRLLQNFKNNNKSIVSNPLLTSQQVRNTNEFRKIEKKQKANPEEEKLINAIIKPIKIEKNNLETTRKFNEAEKTYKVELNEYWKKRNNKPYKVILKDQDFTKDFKTKEDLIVHKITEQDKIGVDKDYVKYVKDKEEHTKDLKENIYSKSKELENKKKFSEYNNKYTYKVAYDPRKGEELKTESIDYYKKQQEELEKDKKLKDEILYELEDNLEKENKIEDKIEIIIQEEKVDKVIKEENNVPEINRENFSVSLKDKYKNRQKKI